ncbi:MAG: SRPBCC domain-containing protein [Bacteroidota bacterium]
METIQFKITIDANKQKVWETMLNDKTYRQWTEAFHAGSYYEGSWDKGSEIKFMGPDNEGKTSGMYAKIKENRKHEFISIEHLGEINDGVIDTTSERIKKWAPSFENYTFKEKGAQTELIVDMQTVPEYKAMFEEMWPKALKSLKELSEK